MLYGHASGKTLNPKPSEAKCVEVAGLDIGWHERVPMAPPLGPRATEHGIEEGWSWGYTGIQRDI